MATLGRSVWLAFGFLVSACGSSDPVNPPPNPDTTPPARVTDLRVNAFSTDSITLAWTAPGDDDRKGTPARYELHYFTSEDLPSEEYPSAIPADLVIVPLPVTPAGSAGGMERYVVAGLAKGTTYSFSVATFDEAGNRSALSPVVFAATIGTNAAGTVMHPVPPFQGYTIPATAVAVQTADALKAALAGTNADIVLEDGTYASATPWKAPRKRLYARHVGRAILAAGVDFGSNTAPTTPDGGGLFGLSVRITAAGQLGTRQAGVAIWGVAGAGTIIQDTTIDGGNIAYFALDGFNPDGLRVERIIVRNALSDCARLSSNKVGPTIVRVWDVDADQCGGAPIPPGTGESGLWIGHPVTDGVMRIRTSNSRWMGLLTASDARDTVFEHITVTKTMVGIYAEHITSYVTFRNLDLHTTGTGFNAEWWYDGRGSHHLTIEDFDITTTVLGADSRAGIFLDAGTYGSTIRRGRIVAENGANGVGYPTSNLCGDANTVDEASIAYQGTGMKILTHARTSECN